MNQIHTVSVMHKSLMQIKKICIESSKPHAYNTVSQVWNTLFNVKGASPGYSLMYNIASVIG